MAAASITVGLLQLDTFIVATQVDADSDRLTVREFVAMLRLQKNRTCWHARAQSAPGSPAPPASNFIHPLTASADFRIRYPDACVPDLDLEQTAEISKALEGEAHVHPSDTHETGNAIARADEVERTAVSRRGAHNHVK